MDWNEILAKVIVAILELLAPIAAYYIVKGIILLVKQIKQDYVRKIVWDAMNWAEAKLVQSSGGAKLEAVVEYVAQKTKWPKDEIQHMVESMITQLNEQWKKQVPNA